MLYTTSATLSALGLWNGSPGHGDDEKRFPASVELKPAHRGRKRTGPSRKDQVVELLRRENGVTIEQLVGMFNWEPHTARAAISVASKWLGIKVERDESIRAYRLPSPPPEA